MSRRRCYSESAGLQSVRPAAVVHTYDFPHALMRYAVSVPRVHAACVTIRTCAGGHPVSRASLSTTTRLNVRASESGVSLRSPSAGLPAPGRRDPQRALELTIATGSRPTAGRHARDAGRVPGDLDLRLRATEVRGRVLL